MNQFIIEQGRQIDKPEGIPRSCTLCLATWECSRPMTIIITPAKLPRTEPHIIHPFCFRFPNTIPRSVGSNKALLFLAAISVAGQPRSVQLQASQAFGYVGAGFLNTNAILEIEIL